MMNFYSAKNVTSNVGDSVVVLFGMLFHGFRFYRSELVDLCGLLGGSWGSGRWLLYERFIYTQGTFFFPPAYTGSSCNNTNGGVTILFTRFSLRRVEGHVAWAHLSSAGHQAPTYDYQGVCVVTFWATNAE